MSRGQKPGNIFKFGESERLRYPFDITIIQITWKAVRDSSYIRFTKTQCTLEVFPPESVRYKQIDLITIIIEKGPLPYIVVGLHGFRPSKGCA
jgi:hypothetical protein